MRGRASTIAAIALAAISSSAAQAQSIFPVEVGGSEMDACPSVGAVRGLDPNGDNFLSVRVRPTTAGTELVRLHEGDRFFMCDEQGSWIGIVWGEGTCGVTTPIEVRRSYNGGCRAGWVHRSFVEPIAG
jgi:hypothetical protein